MVFGFAYQLLKESEGQVEATDQVTFDPHIALCRTTLGYTAFGAAWVEGQRLSLEQAIAYALRS